MIVELFQVVQEDKNGIQNGCSLIKDIEIPALPPPETIIADEGMEYRVKWFSFDLQRGKYSVELELDRHFADKPIPVGHKFYNWGNTPEFIEYIKNYYLARNWELYYPDDPRFQ